jgi:hypothetical protein
MLDVVCRVGGFTSRGKMFAQSSGYSIQLIIAVIYTLGVFEGKRAGVVVGSGRMVLEGRVEYWVVGRGSETFGPKNGGSDGGETGTPWLEAWR